MKNLIVLFLAVVLFTLTNCNKEDEFECPVNETWTVIEMHKTQSYFYIHAKNNGNGKTYLMTANREQWNENFIGSQICDICEYDEVDGISYCD